MKTGIIGAVLIAAASFVAVNSVSAQDYQKQNKSEQRQTSNPAIGTNQRHHRLKSSPATGMTRHSEKTYYGNRRVKHTSHRKSVNQGSKNMNNNGQGTRTNTDTRTNNNDTRTNTDTRTDRDK